MAIGCEDAAVLFCLTSQKRSAESEKRSACQRISAPVQPGTKHDAWIQNRNTDRGSSAGLVFGRISGPAETSRQRKSSLFPFHALIRKAKVRATICARLRGDLKHFLQTLDPKLQRKAVARKVTLIFHRNPATVFFRFTGTKPQRGSPFIRLWSESFGGLKRATNHPLIPPSVLSSTCFPL